MEQVAALPDPVGTVLAEWTRPNGLRIQRVRVPLGVIGIIYESRPNVTADAGALCLKSGNAAILRGGSESHRSSTAIHACLLEGLREAGLPEAAIQLVPTTDRAAVGSCSRARRLDRRDRAARRQEPVARVQQEARVPVIGHLEGNCHVYVDRAADLRMARAIVRERQDAPHRRLRRRRDAAGRRAAAPRRTSAPIVSATCCDAGCEVRGDAARAARSIRAFGRRPRTTGTPSISTR